MKYLSLALCFVFMIEGMKAQVITARQYVDKANIAYDKRDYNTALEYLNIVLKDEPERSDLYWKTAESAFMTRRFALANFYYEKITKSREANDYELLDYRRGLVKKSLEDYDMAIKMFEKYLEAHPQGAKAADARDEIEICEWAKTIVYADKKYEVKHLDSIVNTTFVEAAPVLYNGNLFYTSAFQANPVAKPVTNVYQSDLVKKGFPININSATEGEHTAHYAQNTEGSRAYYNVCKQLADGNFHCTILMREKGADGTWGKPVKLDTTVNSATYTATQPSVGFDKERGVDVLYFVSDRPNGKGGLDIWAADLKANGQPNQPRNLADVNTVKDDITPFFYNVGQILFYSTDGLKTLGGYDVYHVEKTKEGWSMPKHGGYPLNSSYDDLYYSYSPGKAFFVSNRRGGMCDTEEKDCICNDIYAYDVTVELKANTLLAGNEIPLNGCRLDLVDLETGKVINYTVNKDSNNFNFPIELEKRYRLIATRDGYSSDTVDFDTKNIMASTTITQTLRLRPALSMKVYVLDKLIRKPLNGATIQIFDDNWKLLKKEVLTGNLYAQSGLEFGKTYRIVASKETYTSDTTVIITDLVTNIKRFEYVDTLYLDPFSGLPVTLYFHNDRPDPGSNDTRTKLTYLQTYSDYMGRLSEYLAAYRRSKGQTDAGAKEVEDFFSVNIKGGYEKLLEFSKILRGYLESGHSLEIVLEGYASPLAKNDYNKNLTNRRVSSVINHFYDYENGIFRPFMRDGRLRIKVEPYGEEKVSGPVSDDARDRKKSVYSVPAMKERKVEIKEVNRFDINKSTGYSPQELLKNYIDLSERDQLSSANGKAIVRFATKSGNTHGIAEYSVKTLKAHTGSKKYEIVMIDEVTGEIIKNKSTIELYDEKGEKMIGKARRKGESSAYVIEQKGSELTNVDLTNGADGAEIVRDTLFLAPFAGLPVSLYFDNNRPFKGKSSASTSWDYDETYREFVARKSDFIKMYNKLMNKDEKIAEENMDDFFDNDVKSGFQKLIGFSKMMNQYLKRGYAIEIKLEGYASPLSNPEYNAQLAKRRVKSVVNQLSNFNDGALKKYIENGKLRIDYESKGEVSTTVPDQLSNKASIYSIDASKERRVTIQDIRILNK